MKVEWNLSIGYPTATHQDILEIDDEELDGMNEKEREEHITSQVEQVVMEYVEWGWKAA